MRAFPTAARSGSRAVMPIIRLLTHSDQSVQRALTHGPIAGLLRPILVSRSHGIAEFPSNQYRRRIHPTLTTRIPSELAAWSMIGSLCSLNKIFSSTVHPKSSLRSVLYASSCPIALNEDLPTFASTIETVSLTNSLELRSLRNNAVLVTPLSGMSGLAYSTNPS